MKQVFDVQREDYQDFARSIFASAPFIEDLGFELLDLGPGWVESRLTLAPRHLQQNGFVHAGVMGTMADHNAGGSASTLLGEDMAVLTVEYKLNLLRPAMGDSLRCRAEVLKAGKTITISESEVYATKDGQEKLVAKATVTLAIVKL